MQPLGGGDVEPTERSVGFSLNPKSSQELLPENIEQDAKQGPSSHFAERAGSGLCAFSSSEELRGLSARAQVRA